MSRCLISVFRRATYTESNNISPRIARQGYGYSRPHDLATQLLHQNFRCRPVGRLPQDRNFSRRRAALRFGDRHPSLSSSRILRTCYIPCETLSTRSGVSNDNVGGCEGLPSSLGLSKHARTKDCKSRALCVASRSCGLAAEAETFSQQAERNLLRYGRTLLLNRPEETTTVLIDLCSGNFLNKQKDVAARRAEKKQTERESDSQAQPASINYLSYLGYDKVTGVFSSSAAAAGGNAADTIALPATAPADTALPAKQSSASGFNAEPETTTYPIPSPRQYFAHFISSPEHFVRFLESIASYRWQQTVSNTPSSTKGAVTRTVEAPIDQGSPTNVLDVEDADQRCVWNTLLELYLTDAQDQTSSSSAVSRQKALNVVDRTGDLPVDPMHALMVCSTAGFTPGQIRLWEKLGMYEEVLRFWMNVKLDDTKPGNQEEERSPTDNVLHYLHLYGPTNSQLYPLVLRYLTADSKRVSQHATDVREILKVIDDENLMPPLAVVQLLSRNNVTSIGVVKDWLRAKVADTRQDVESVSLVASSHEPALNFPHCTGSNSCQVISLRDRRKAQGDRQSR